MTIELDNPVWHSLARVDPRLAIGSELARRYDPAVAPFAGLPDVPDDASWSAAAALAGSGPLALQRASLGLPAGWTVDHEIDAIQMIATSPVGVEDDRIHSLTDDDADDMRRLAAEAQPGPFASRTHELGGYVGVRIDDELVAMAGERMHVDGFAEVSAVAASPRHRGRGLGPAVLLAVAHRIEARGERVFLHVATANPARRLYERLGFVERQRMPLTFVTPIR